jgi:class 3 adenylate cyclase/predicted ATPase
MLCAKCGSDNREGAKFCAECATPFAAKCPRCGATNSPGDKFCDECAAPLQVASRAAAATPLPVAHESGSEVRIRPERPDELTVIDGERKTVTALFADIKGSTELMEELDPEEARAIIDPALKLMIDSVRRYDGYVVQSTGDGIFALFGAPVAREDHPQRALYAALRMQQELSSYGTKLQADGHAPLEIRVGANTGEVVVRSIATGAAQVEYTPIGHTTNLASRLQNIARTGSVVISESTRKLCEGYFVLKPLGATRLKGVSEPVNLYEVLGLGPLRTRLQRAARLGLTKFVGRAREMEVLGHAAELAMGGKGQIVAAMAEPGVGKSRLFFEFKATSQGGWMRLETFSISHGKASAYLPVIDLLRNYFDISATDDERKRREKVTGRVLALDRKLEDTLPHLFSLLGIVEVDDPLAQMDGQVRRRRTLEAVKRLLLRESLNQPLMVEFEDLHWIDEQTQELLNLLVDSIGTARILLLVNYRPEYLHQWSNKTYYTQLRLDPLGKESAEDMLSSLLGDGKDLTLLKRLIIQRTEGTPFFMEEIIQALFEDGVLQGSGTVTLAKSMSAVQVPATVQAVLAARIDRLPADEKELLQTLAVLGREFSLDLVQRVMLYIDNDLHRMLGNLQTAEFIYEQPAAGGIEYIFKHALTQEVAYKALLVTRRKFLHERAGSTLESMFAAQLDDHLDELAHHYSLTDNFEKAVEYLGRAGQQALQRSGYMDAITSLGKGLNLVQKLSDSLETVHHELSLQLALGRALEAVRGFGAPDVELAFSRARELCERLGDPPELFPTLYGLWVMHLVRGELRRAYELAEQLLNRARNATDPVLLMYAQMARGVVSYWMGDFVPVREKLEEAIAIYNPESHRPLIFRYGGTDTGMVSHTHKAWTLWQLGYPDQALKQGTAALSLARQLSHPFSQAQAEFFIGFLHQYRRDASAVQEAAESVIALSAEHGLVQLSADATALRGWAIVQQQGRTLEGIAQIQESLAASRAIGVELWRPYFLGILAEAYMNAALVDDGLTAITEALDTAKKHENHHNRAEIHRLKGELLLEQNNSNAVEAQSCFMEAIEIARKQNAKSWELRATTSLARLLDSQGRRDGARSMLADIYNWFTEGFDTADVKEARALLDELKA